MSKIQRNKLVFVETVDNAEMNMALSNYRKVWVLYFTSDNVPMVLIRDVQLVNHCTPQFQLCLF